MNEHYFSSSPSSAAHERSVTVTLAGRTVAVTTAAGVFSPDGIDRGTQVLLKHVPTPAPGVLVDLGCGWGPIALSAALMQPGLDVVAVDVNERSRDLTARNAAALARSHQMGAVRVVDPADVPADFTCDTVWSNPPIRVGKEQLHQMLGLWLPRLRPGGEAWLVVAKQLGADSLVRWLGESHDGGQPWGQCDRVATDKGFRVLRFTRAQ